MIRAVNKAGNTLEDEMATPKRTYTATYNGKNYTRKTIHSYSHALAFTRTDGTEFVYTWCRRLDLAEAAKKKYSAPGWGYPKIEIVEAHEVC